MTDNYEARDVIDKETLSTVKSVGDSYKYGFSTDIETEYAPLGLNEDIVRLISKKNNEPSWMLDWRLKAFNRWKKLKQPDWALLASPEIDFQKNMKNPVFRNGLFNKSIACMAAQIDLEALAKNDIDIYC